MDLFIQILAALVSVTNPLGTVPVFTALTKDYSKSEKNAVAIKTALNVLVILLVSFFLGSYVLDFFGITITSLKIAGGLIITLSGFALLRGEFNKHKGMHKESVQEDIKSRTEIALTPLALPMIAGPGTISLLITYNNTLPNIPTNLFWILGALVLAATIIYLTLRASGAIVRVLGASGINALSRIVGFIVISIGVEFIISALKSYFY